MPRGALVRTHTLVLLSLAVTGFGAWVSAGIDVWGRVLAVLLVLVAWLVRGTLEGSSAAAS